MKYIYKILPFLLLSFLLFSCSEDLVDKVEMGTLKGIVIKKGTNLPLKNVKISTNPTTTTVFTKDDGSFSIENVPLGDYSVKSEITGYVTSLQGANMKNSGQTVSVVFEMNDDDSQNSPPSVPTLLSPIDNAINQPLSVNLSWSSNDPDKKDSLTYRLVIKNDFDSNVLEVKDLTKKTYFLENLKFGVNYFWQVMVSDGINPEVNSVVFRFKTNAIPENRFHYVQKTNGNYNIVSSNENNVKFNFTSLSTNSWRPRLNQNSKLVAFLRTVGGNAQIFTAKLDGSNVFQVTTIPVSGFNNTELNFSWNKNGNEFIYANFSKLYKINKDGSGLQLLYTTPDGSFISECEWSYDGSKIALKTNNANGYNVKIFIIDMLGNTIKTVVENVMGAAGSINLSVDGKYLLYSYDMSGHQDENYRQLDANLFIYDLTIDAVQNISLLSKKINGTNDLDARFSPNDAEVIFMNSSNDGISAKKISKIILQDYTRTDLFPDAEMPDWE